jgi:sugar lactone lactonase YvrE
MRIFWPVMFLCVFCVQLGFNCFAQSGVITTYAGSRLTANGALAGIELFHHFALDGVGGFYVSSPREDRIYHVTADGGFRLAAGIGMPGYSGDGSKAMWAQLNYPYGVAVDPRGNLYIADGGNNRIRKVTPDGVITTIAGNGKRGFSGDRGLAITAGLSVGSIAVDSKGNIFFTDGYANRIRKVAPDGYIMIVAGNGTRGFGGDGGPATAAQLAPASIAVDSAGNLFIADYWNHRIRKVVPSGLITTIAGNGARGFGGDGGPATSALLAAPKCVAVDFAGNLYIADSGNNRIRKVTPDGVITTLAGNGNKGNRGDDGQAPYAQLNDPSEVAVDSAGDLFIVDSGNHCIRKITPDRLITTVAGGNVKGKSFLGGDNGPATSAKLQNPSGAALDSVGNLYIADQGNHRIRKVTPAGIISTIAGGGLKSPKDEVLAASASLERPHSIVVDSAGNLYYVDLNTIWAHKVNPAGVLKSVPGGGLRKLKHGLSNFISGEYSDADLIGKGPHGMAMDSSGNLYIADTNNCQIWKVTPGGKSTTIAGNGKEGYNGDGITATSALMGPPFDVAVDSVGNIYIADTYNARIRKVGLDGLITTLAGNGIRGYGGDGGPAALAQLSWPYGIAVDSTNNIYIADTQNNRIRKVTPDGLITTVAGNGTEGCDGDSGPATSAQLRWPEDIAVDSAGTLYIADTGNNCIRKVTPLSRESQKGN